MSFTQSGKIDKEEAADADTPPFALFTGYLAHNKYFAHNPFHFNILKRGLRCKIQINKDFPAK
ncbi:hypothetical protein [Tunturibacter empetritectus]|uniref:Uncharacterized protein n=1 Tax=Tunturiibacter lichenicola TaxID=2051959 RepID=A0A7W8N3V8_9BACT|nr:hypothetical protein [Edaphobacter lichenicola]MBB5344927.1 hypothetical protein [Edaphobacter lichenicola]